MSWRRVGQTFGLSLHGEDLEEHTVVDAGRLRQLLAPYASMVRLVVLAACDSGNSGELGNQLGSVAQALHRAGVAQVVASRYPISVAGSIRLVQVLYRELLSATGSLEQAVLSARHSLARDASQIDWGKSPALQPCQRPCVFATKLSPPLAIGSIGSRSDDDRQR